MSAQHDVDVFARARTGKHFDGYDRNRRGARKALCHDLEEVTVRSALSLNQIVKQFVRLRILP
jgi:hypothetical protein